jgi:hypothetical protein
MNSIKAVEWQRLGSHERALLNAANKYKGRILIENKNETLGVTTIHRKPKTMNLVDFVMCGMTF